MSAGFVSLVGAGPGDPGLLTVRALERIRAADVVAHDELVSEAILALVPHGVRLLSVGRRFGHGPTSYRLHPDVLSYARAGKRVVRLKAGDPLVFGRGGEEAEELSRAGIRFEIVPGITAALGAAASACIPLTHRDLASEVLLTSGHHAGRPPRATGPGTVVLYMAVRALEANVARLVAEGRPESTPAAIVANATTAAERVVTGTLGTLAARASEVPPQAPALVIVGDVVRARERIAI